MPTTKLLRRKRKALQTTAFLTGSRSYGTPTDTSDVDLVVRVDRETRAVLVAELTDDKIDDEYGDGIAQFKVGTAESDSVRDGRAVRGLAGWNGGASSL